jgi:hypothetical protein
MASHHHPPANRAASNHAVRTSSGEDGTHDAPPHARQPPIRRASCPSARAPSGKPADHPPTSAHRHQPSAPPPRIRRALFSDLQGSRSAANHRHHTINTINIPTRPSGRVPEPRSARSAAAILPLCFPPPLQPLAAQGRPRASVVLHNPSSLAIVVVSPLRPPGTHAHCTLAHSHTHGAVRACTLLLPCDHTRCPVSIICKHHARSLSLSVSLSLSFSLSLYTAPSDIGNRSLSSLNRRSVCLLTARVSVLTCRCP